MFVSFCRWLITYSVLVFVVVVVVVVVRVSQTHCFSVPFNSIVLGQLFDHNQEYDLCIAGSDEPRVMLRIECNHPLLSILPSRGYWCHRLVALSLQN